MSDWRVNLRIEGAGGNLVRRAGDALLRALARVNVRAWGRSRRRDDDGVSRFLITASSTMGTMLPRSPELTVDLDRGSLSHGGSTYALPIERLSEKKEDASALLAGAAAGLLGLDVDAAWGGRAPWTAGHAYAAANFPALERGFPPSAMGKESELAVFHGVRAAAAGAFSAGCRYAVSTRPCPGFEAIARSGLGLTLERTQDGDAAVLRAAAAGFSGVRSLALIDEPGLRRAEDALRWAARAEVPMVLLVVDAGEAAFSQAMAHACRTSPFAVLAPTSLEDLYHAMSEAYALADRCQSPVLVFSDRLLTERWETLERPLEAQSSERARMRGVWATAPTDGERFDRYAGTDSGISPRAVPGQEGLMFAAAAGSRSDKLERKYDTLRAELAKSRGAFFPEGETLVVAWGGSCAALREALDVIGREGGPRAVLAPVRVPVPLFDLQDYAALRGAKRIIAAESTPGQPLRRWLRMAAGIDVADVLLLDSPFDPERTLPRLREALDA